MDKIKELLKKSGCKQELVDSIIESLVGYKQSVLEDGNKEVSAKIERAKQVCLDETNAHKQVLARRLQTFCEAKSVAIEAQLAKKSALSESESAARLQQLKDLLEGIEPSGSSNGVATTDIAKVKRIVKEANGEKLKAVELANKQTQVAQKALKQVRYLTTQIENLKRERHAVNESRSNPTQRIDSQRSRSKQPVTSRKTLIENQDRAPVRKRNEPSTTSPNGANGGIGYIAESMESDLI